MNLDDLQHELHARADGVSGPTVTGPGVTASRLAGVRHRAQVARRRRAAAALATVVVLAGGAVGLPKLPMLHQEATPATPVKADFPDHYNGDPLIVREIGQAGANPLTLEFTPTDANIRIVTTCFVDQVIAKKYDEKPDGITATVAINGNDLNAGCGEGAYTEFVQNGQSPSANRKAWGEQGVKAGRPSTVTFSYIGTPPRSLRLAVAVYQLNGERTEVSGYRLPSELTFGDKTYRLGSSEGFALSGSVRSATQAIASGDVLCGIVYAKNPQLNADIAETDELTATGVALAQPQKIGAHSDQDLWCGLVGSDGGSTAGQGTMTAAHGSRGAVVVAVYRLTAT